VVLIFAVFIIARARLGVVATAPFGGPFPIAGALLVVAMVVLVVLVVLVPTIFLLVLLIFLVLFLLLALLFLFGRALSHLIIRVVVEEGVVSFLEVFVHL